MQSYKAYLLVKKRTPTAALPRGVFSSTTIPQFTSVPKDSTAWQKIVGKPVLSNGIELKSLKETSNLRKRVEKDLRNAYKKKHLRNVILTQQERGLRAKK